MVWETCLAKISEQSSNQILIFFFSVRPRATVSFRLYIDKITSTFVSINAVPKKKSVFGLNFIFVPDPEFTGKNEILCL